ncbi:MAG: hypothetical protein JSW64_09330 [Candidatus Zixiibacteriota bacterium]|nr:MAG: hypothetical protein JSW64_09330 [candidate division Zixibacteria bacterium]
MEQFKSNKEKGSVLVMAVVLSFAMFIMGLGFLTSVDYYENSISDEVAYAKNLYTQSYITQILNTAVKNGDLYPGSYGEWNEFFDENTCYRAYVGFTGGVDDGFFYGSRRGYFVYAQAKTTFYGADYDIIRSSATYEILETFADYLYLSDCEEDPVRNDRIRFWGPDTLDGKVHSNDTIHVQYGQGHWPRFMKKTTSCAPYILPFNHQATFDEGFFPNAESIYFPDQADEIRIRTMRSNFGTFDPDSVTELTFDGRRIIVRFCGPGDPPYQNSLVCDWDQISQSQDVMTIPGGDAALFVHGKIFIKANRGRPDLMDPSFNSLGFEGRLTVASSDTMIIYDNLVYKNAAADNSVPIDITDCLGLISESAIMVGDSVGDTVYINAALASIGGTISVRDIYDYGTPGNPNDNEKQSLFIYGSLAMLNRGIVHTTHNGWGDRGFIEKDYHYDTRLQMDPPPYFIRASEHNTIYKESRGEDI